jgi:hypothetical protein
LEEKTGGRMKWRKEGLIFAPKGDLWWAQSYALLPTAEVLDNETIRIYFASLDSDRFGRVGCLAVDARDPRRVLDVTPDPILDLGRLGTFDDSGVNPSSVITTKSRRFLYYVGWQRSQRVPYALFSGLAASEDGLTFARVSEAPILDRSNTEPFLRSAPCVLHEDGIFKMWYVSALEWTIINGTQYPTYVIRYVESTDGRVWGGNGRVCINLEDGEFGLGRPWVIRDGPIYKMWFSIRSRTAAYRLGFAESADGISWTRRDSLAGITRSDKGWDSEMICYACVVKAGQQTYMFYNGNRHGSTGFGYAALDE